MKKFTILTEKACILMPQCETLYYICCYIDVVHSRDRNSWLFSQYRQSSPIAVVFSEGVNLSRAGKFL